MDVTEAFNLSLSIYIALVIIIPVSTWITAKILSLTKSNPIKNATYECGQIFTGKAHVNWTIQYYPYAMIYAIFGATAIFLLIAAPEILKIKLAVEYGFMVFAVVILTLVSAVVSVRKGE